MKKVLKSRCKDGLYYYAKCLKVAGPNPNLNGDCSGVRGNCSGLLGNLGDAELTQGDRSCCVDIRNIIDSNKS